MLSLTSAPLTINGRLCHAYEHDGKQVTVCDSMLNALLIIELFADEDMQPESKQQLLPMMLFPDARLAFDGFHDPWEMVVDVLWQAFNLDIAGRHAEQAGEQLFDWEQDAQRIKSSLQMAYGIDWDTAANERSFHDVCGLLGMLVETKDSTPFGEAIYYRTATPPEPNKYNADERKRFISLQKHFALDGVGAATTDRQASAIFDRIWKESQNG